jgi:hypothetical protein
MNDQILESLKELESFLAGEVRSFDEATRIARDKGMGKACSYCLGVSHAYNNALAKVRLAIPARLIRDITRSNDGNMAENA